MIRAIDLKKNFGKLEIIKGVSLEINSSEMLAIVGPSGAGKSTLLHLLSSLEKPDSGQIFFKNKELTRLSRSELNTFRNQKIGFIFQFHHLLPEFSAWENICIPAWIKGQSSKQSKQRAFELLEKMNLLDRAEHKPSELSGGEQQRVAIARALINQPEVIFADEPTGNLDSNNAEHMDQLFHDLVKQYQLSLVIVTHNLDLAKKADRIVTMKDGQILSEPS